MKLAALLLVLLSLPCAAVQYDIEYARAEDIPYICYARGGAQGQVDDTMAGCTVGRAGGRQRMVIPVGSKFTCVYWHELRHVYEGDWHHGRKATSDEGCNWRPPT